MIWLLLSLIIASALGVTSFKKKEARVVMETTKGSIELKLYNETPLHRDRFLSLVKVHANDSLLFHRVIRDCIDSDFHIVWGRVFDDDSLQDTVFGEVVSGQEVVEAIQNSATDDNARPLDDIHVIRAYQSGL